MKTKERKGISLIVLVIAIIIIIILASVVILNVTKNNPIESAKKAKFLSDMDTMKTELELYVTKKQVDTLGDYERKLLESTKDKIVESGKEDTSRNITDILSSIKGTKYEEKIEIINGQIVYVGKDKNEIEWSNEKNIEVTAVKINITNESDKTSIKGKISVTGTIADASKIEKYEIYVARKNEEYSNTASKIIEEKSLNVNYEIDWQNIKEEYKLKVKLIMDGISYEKEITGADIIAPDIEQITVTKSTNTWTSEDITLTINNIPEDASIVQYTRPNTTTWINYNEPFSVSENGEVNIRVEDKAGNEAVKTIIIDKIDKLSANINAENEHIKISVGESNNIENYFNITQNGNAPISEITYKNVSNNSNISDTSGLEAGSHTIECLVTKETGKTSSKTIKISVIDYGTTISSMYEKLYVGIDSGNLQNYPDERNYGNFIGRYIMDIEGNENEIISHQDIHNGTGSYADRTFNQNYIYYGQNYYPLEKETSLNNWISIAIYGIWSTVNVQVGNFSLKFKDGSEYTLEDSVKYGYIEPLVLISSVTSIEAMNIISNGMTNISKYPSIYIYVKIKNKSPLIGLNLYSNCDFVKDLADGLMVYQMSKGFDISISPW